MAEFLKKWKKYLTFAALLSCFVNIFQLTFPFYMFAIYRNIVVSYSEFSLANITAAAFFAVVILGLFSYLRSRLLARAGKALNLSLRKDICTAMVRSCVVDPARSYRGGMNDLGTLHNYCSSPAVYALFDAPWAPFYLALIYLIHPVLGMVATSGAVIMVALSVLQEILVGKSLRAANKKSMQNQQFVESFMRNVDVINGMGMIGNITSRFNMLNREVMENQIRSSYHAGAVQAAIKPLQNVIQVLIYCFGAYFAMKEGFDVGLMVAASIIMGRGLAPLMQFMSSWRQASMTRQAYERVKGLSAMAQARGKNTPLPVPKGRLEVSHALFRIKDQVLINGVNFSLEPGEFLGLIGPSGAGKTTLCRLILGIWPSFGGKVFLDGRDIFGWDKEEIGAHIGYLPQEVTLFPGTVAENVARFGPVDENLLNQALGISGCKEMVDKLPKGVKTILEREDGIKLSGGQCQKLGLARALYGNPKLLVLDEPTSNLDEAGEHQLVKALQILKESRACTCVMVTHKPSLLQPMDKVLVLKNGMAAFYGPRDQVFSDLTGRQSPLASSTQTTSGKRA